ncbi:GntR family transcriptional regulator [Winogradskya humida]|uniref:GntR family transcriptional regulator n=1 Tax=Winogradskya humida TaxID=113566 RepID=A0ABQ4A434_9ACTN|nr:GntR family transcriptional regulator [Actinoplanes humidus]GIE25611.1 GntR family transcriptional regulator [Actinoplanes humidus]
MPPTIDRQPPPYQQIADHFRREIRDGRLKDGDRLPSARQLVTDWNVAHATAAKVLTTLRAEGLVRTTPGGAGGTVVDVQKVGTPARDRMLSTRRTGNIYAKGTYAKIVAADLVEAPDEVAEALGIPAGSQVIRRQRITYRNDVADSTSISWFPGALADSAPDLLVADRIKLGTAGYIEQQTGRIMAAGRDQVTAGQAEDAVAEILGIAAGEPILLGRNWVLDSGGDVIEFGQSVSAAGRWQTYEYEINT